MPASTTPVFGKRNAAGPANRAASAAAASVDHAAFFAAVRAELADPQQDEAAFVVPRSLKAAFLAALVTGCALVGFNVAEPSGQGSFGIITNALGVAPEALGWHGIQPAAIFLGLLSGARIGALTIIVVHTVLAEAGRTSHAAYALGSAAASAVMSGALFLLFDHAPAHGWVVELLAGASAGFLYRVLAGRRPAADTGAPPSTKVP